MSQCHCQADNSVTLPLPSRQQCHSATAMQATVSHCQCQADKSVTVPLPSRQQCHIATAKQTKVSHCHCQADNSVTVPRPYKQQCLIATANSVPLPLPSRQQCPIATAMQTTVSHCHCHADNSCLCPILPQVGEPQQHQIPLFSYGVKTTKPEPFALHQDNSDCPMHLALICGTEWKALLHSPGSSNHFTI